MENNNKELLAKVFSFMRPHLREQFVTLVCLIIGSVVSLQYPLVVKIIVDDVLINQNANMLVTMLGVYVFLFLLGFFLSFITQCMNTLNTQLFAFGVKKKLFTQLERAPMSAMNKTNTAEIVSTFNADIDSISRFLSTNLLDIINNILNIIVVVIIIMILNWKMALFFLAVSPFYYLSHISIRGFIKSSLEKRRELVSTQNKLLQNVFPNVKQVKLLVTQRFFLLKFLHLQDETIKTEVRTAVLTSVLEKMASIIYIVGNVIILWYGSNLIFQNALTIGGLMAFYTYVPILFTSIRIIVNSSVQFRNFMIAFKKISRFLDLESEDDTPSRNRITDGAVGFENVSFAFDEKKVLQNLNLEIRPGEKVALIGKNGSGKTTMMNLLLRLYDIQQGRIVIDGMEISKYSRSYLRKNIGIVTQETSFFNLTIEENFRIVVPRLKQEDMVRACQLTGAHDFIKELPKGYQTVIGERGLNFSGGQMQKLAISRLILKNPRIVVFDEATSALDPEGTQVFYSLFDKAFLNRTIIFILHDMKSVIHADRVILLKDGVVEREFSREELFREHDLILRLTKEIA